MVYKAEIGREVKPIAEYRNESWKCEKCSFCQMSNPDTISSIEFDDNCIRGSRYRFGSYYANGTFEAVRALTAEPPELGFDEHLQHIIFSCTLCGNCQVNCNPTHFLDPLNVSISLRQFAVQQGWGPLPEHQKVIDSILEFHNSFRENQKDRGRWAEGLDLIDAGKTQVDNLYFAGCAASFDPGLHSVARSAAQVLIAGGLKPGYLYDKEYCCGSYIFRTGDQENFAKVRQATAGVLNKTGAKQILTACAEGYATLKQQYEKFLEPPVKHVVEAAAEMIQDGKLKPAKSLPMKVTYHDPCLLGRYLKVYKAPRQILNAIDGIELLEMERAEEASWCCGAGGGCRTAYHEDISLWAAKERLREAKATGADTIATCCPYCEQILAEAGEKYPEVKMAVKDVIEILNDSLG